MFAANTALRVFNINRILPPYLLYVHFHLYLLHKKELNSRKLKMEIGMGDLKIIIDIIGWIGAGCLLAAYLLVSNGKLDAKSYFYQNLNLIGAFSLIINTYYYETFALVFLNSVWALIGLNTLRKIRFS